MNVFLDRLIMVIVLVAGIFLLNNSLAFAKNKQDASMLSTQIVKTPKGKAYQKYLDYFEKVYQTMQENYYQPVSRDSYDGFIKEFNEKIYSQLKDTKKSDDFVRWKSASLLIKRLKSSEDIFSELYPPKPAQEYKQTALGIRHDLGIEGNLVGDKFEVIKLEPRADPYIQGIRVGDFILSIDSQNLASLTQDKIQELLNPLENTKALIRYLSSKESIEKEIEVVSKEYFKQSVFMKPVPYEGILCLEIARFNQKTSEDLFRYLDYFRKSKEMAGLIIDLRGNPGGPPLAAREISAFFLPGGEDFAYFQKKDQPKQMLDIPKLPEQYHYDGPMVVLLNEKSGSSSELFSGVLQKRKRAAIMGRNSAGQVMLKSMFNLDDQSMMLLVTGRGYHPDGSVFSFNGVTPDKYFETQSEDQIIPFAASYIYYLRKQKQDESSNDARSI